MASFWRSSNHEVHMPTAWSPAVTIQLNTSMLTTWASWYLKPPAIGLVVQHLVRAYSKDNVNAPQYRPFLKEPLIAVKFPSYDYFFNNFDLFYHNIVSRIITILLSTDLLLTIENTATPPWWTARDTLATPWTPSGWSRSLRTIIIAPQSL